MPKSTNIKKGPELQYGINIDENLFCFVFSHWITFLHVLFLIMWQYVLNVTYCQKWEILCIFLFNESNVKYMIMYDIW